MTDDARRAARTLYVREWRKKNPERARAANARQSKGSGRAWKKANADRLNAERRAGYRQRYLARQYGITIEQFDALLVKQHGRCAICATATPEKRGRKSDKENWHVDHDHETGVVRGLLCFACNVGIGHLKDDPVLVKAALNYLLGT